MNSDYEGFEPSLLKPPGQQKVAPATENAKRTLDDLIARALAYSSGPELKELLDFSRRFPHYAPYNAMLLHVQNPGIRYAVRASVWEDTYERRVNPGARPYVVLQTMGPVAFVFDISDTHPIDPSHDLVPALVVNPFPTKGNAPPKAMKRLTDACAKVGIVVVTQDLGSNLAGDVRRAAVNGSEFHLRLNVKHTGAQQLGTLAHELAHVFCGHLGEDRAGIAPDRPVRTLTPQVQEFEAEAVAYLVTDRLNLDVGSVAYLAGYISETKPIPGYSLDAVLKAAGKIEEMLQGRFRLKKDRERRTRVTQVSLTSTHSQVAHRSLRGRQF